MAKKGLSRGSADDEQYVKDIIDDNSVVQYIGTIGAGGVWPDGTWRIVIDAGLLAFEKKEVGVWVKYQTMGE